MCFPLEIPRSSGMGIPICARLAELMGGAIALADRDDGPGARFTLRLPIPDAAHEAAAAAAAYTTPAGAADSREGVPRNYKGASHGSGGPAPAAAAPKRLGPMRGTRVLAVDDSPANLRFVVFMLKRLGCVVETCADGDEVRASCACLGCLYAMGEHARSLHACNTTLT